MELPLQKCVLTPFPGSSHGKNPVTTNHLKIAEARDNQEER
jgi:hypothetical protein